MELEALHIQYLSILRFIHYATEHLTPEEIVKLMKIYQKFSKETK